jgi:hypothetical protein
MYPLLHPDLGKPTAREADADGFLLPLSGLSRLFARLLGAFCAILAVTLLLDAAARAPDGPTETIAATDNPAKEGK